MEVISAVSAIAGILGLLGQTIQSTQKLKGFFTDVTSASETVKLLLSDIDFLLTTLHDVSNLVDALPPEFEGSQIVTLRSKLESYKEDSSRWIKTAGKLRPASDIGARMWFKKFRVAVNMKSVTDLRNVLDTHKQNINLSLHLLGRALEVSTAAGVGQLDRKLSAGTAASLSKIEEQNNLLEVIESYSRSSMQTSAASVKSLQSIATSLSRIEALASKVSVSGYDTADESGDADLKNYTRPKSIRRTRALSVDTKDTKDTNHESHARRRSDGDFDPRGRRLSTGPYSCGRSSTSVQSLPAVPAIPAVYRLMKNDSKPFDEGLSRSRLRTLTRTHFESHQKANGGTGSQRADDESSGFSSPQGNTDKYLEVDARLQDECWSRLFQHLAKQHGPLIAHYISLKRSIEIYECQLRLFSLVNQGLDTSVTSGCEFQSVDKEKKILQDRVKSLQEDFKLFRKTCIELGTSLYEIDQLISRNTTSKHPHQYWDQHNAPFELHSTETSMPELTEGGKFSVHGGWSTDRDRINLWLLHCLQSDESQRQLHKSMLAEIPDDPSIWQRQVLQHWYVDEAAVGVDFQFSPSVGAVEYDLSSESDSSASREEAIVDELQNLFPMDDPNDSWDLGILTAEDIWRLYQADENLLPLGTRRWIGENGRHTHEIPIYKSLKALVGYWDLARCGKTYALEQFCNTEGMRNFSAGVYYLLDRTRRLEIPRGAPDRKRGLPRLRCPKELHQDRKALLLSLHDFLEGAERIEIVKRQRSLAEVEDAIFDDLTYSAFKLASRAVKYTNAWSRLSVEADYDREQKALRRKTTPSIRQET